MKMRTRSVTCLGLLALCVGVWFHSPVTAEEIGFDFWHLGDLENQIAHSESKNLEMERNDQLIMGRIGLRHEILKKLITDKITLEEAGRAFLALNKVEPSAINYLRMMYPNGTDYDRALCQVVMQMQFHHLPGSAECHLRLKCELVATRGHVCR